MLITNARAHEGEEHSNASVAQMTEEQESVESTDPLIETEKRLRDARERLIRDRRRLLSPFSPREQSSTTTTDSGEQEGFEPPLYARDTEAFSKRIQGYTATLTERAEKLAEQREGAQDVRKLRIIAYTKRLIERYLSAAEKIENLTTRIYMHIERLEEEGHDMSKERSILLDVEENIVEFREAIEHGSASLSELALSFDPNSTLSYGNTLQDIRSSFSDAKLLLVESREKLSELVSGVKREYGETREGE